MAELPLVATSRDLQGLVRPKLLLSIICFIVLFLLSVNAFCSTTVKTFLYSIPIQICHFDSCPLFIFLLIMYSKQGYFQALFSCIERMLISLKIEHFMLPAAQEAEAIWMKKFGFSKIPQEQVCYNLHFAE